MPKAMLFVDGTWLYSNMPKLLESFGRTDFHLDFGKLPRVLAEEVGRQTGGIEVDMVRTHLFGSYAANCDPRDEDSVLRRLDFFSLLKEQYHYEVELFPTNFRGRRLRRIDRDPRDPFEPKEKSVEISLTTALLFYAAIPSAYDIAIALLGEQDFQTAFQHVRRLGKRVAIASIKGSCAPDYYDGRDDARVKDFDVIWLDDLMSRLELKYDPHQLACESPNHQGERMVWTTFHPRRGQRFYCDNCRAEFSRQRYQSHGDFSAETNGNLLSDTTQASIGRLMNGDIKKKVGDRGFGFIQASDGRDYYFHLTDLEPGLDFDLIQEGLSVQFEVRREPSYDRAGAAQRVRRAAGAFTDETVAS